MNFLQKPSLTWQKFRDFVRYPTHSRTLSLLGIFAFVGIISLTVIVAQQQQNLKQKASGVLCEDTSIPECPPGVASGNDCTSSGARCRLGNIIVECRIPPAGGGEGD